jgi:hypothetical protein
MSRVTCPSSSPNSCSPISMVMTHVLEEYFLHWAGDQALLFHTHFVMGGQHPLQLVVGAPVLLIKTAAALVPLLAAQCLCHLFRNLLHLCLLQSWASKIAAAVASEDRRDGLGNGALPSYQVWHRLTLQHCLSGPFHKQLVYTCWYVCMLC